MYVYRSSRYFSNAVYSHSVIVHTLSITRTPAPDPPSFLRMDLQALVCAPFSVRLRSLNGVDGKGTGHIQDALTLTLHVVNGPLM